MKGVIDIRGNTIKTANAVIYHDDEGALEYLLVKESDGSWGFAGGAKNTDDTDLIETLQRELQEELGLEKSEYQIRETDILHKFEYSDKSSSRVGKIGEESIFLVETTKTDDFNLAKDILDYRWFNSVEAQEKLSLIEFFGYRAKLLEQAIAKLE